MNNDKHWLLRPKSIKLLWLLMYVFLVLTLALELLIPHQGHFGIDASFGFSAWFGFLSCFLMVVAAKLLGILIKRKDNYYEEQNRE